MDNTIKGILERMNIREEDVQKLAGVKTASQNTNANPVSEFLTKVAEDMGAMNDQEKLEMIKQAVEELLAKKQSGQMLDPEEEQFLAEAQGMVGGGMNVTASVKKTAAGLGDGPGSLDANIAEQKGLMAEAFKKRQAAGIETSPSAENVKGDDEPGYQNAAAMKKDHSAPATQVGPNGSFENPKTASTKTAMAKLAEKAMYAKTVDAIADYCIEKMAHDMKAAQQAQYQEKVAAVNELKQAAELEGRFMADAFVDQLRKNIQ